MTENVAAQFPEWHLRRRAVPIVAVLLMLAAWLALWTLPSEHLDRGMRTTSSFLAAVLAAVVVGVWYFGMAGVSRRTRAVTALALLILLIGFLGSLRRVEFSGDMQPTFDFRWQTSREAKLDSYLASEQKGENIVAVSTAVVQPSAEDSPCYRGANTAGIVVGPALARDWQKHPPRCLWRHPCGGGYASYAVIGDSAVTLEQRGPEEVVVCYDISTGRHRWKYAYPAMFSEKLGGDGPRATPAIHDRCVYSLGAAGDLVKLDFTTGELEWRVNILAENGSGNLEWGMSGSPLVVDGQVIVNPGAQQGTETSADVLGFDDADGRVVTRAGNARSSYSSPMLATLLGVPQLIIFDAAGLAGFDPAGGQSLWRVPWTSDFDINAAQPVVLDDRHIVITSQAGCALIEFALAEGHWIATQVWRNRQMKCSYANPVARDGFLYGLDEGILACLCLKTGKRAWKERAGQYGHGQLLLAGDLLLVLSEKGELALVEATPEAFRELGRIQAIDGKTWNNPVLVRGRALVRNHLEMACYELPLADAPE
ncbi:MAG TPA: PQQ-binding-like beta-propeller repeat protein [Pirellulales bacterium]|nr:PQQ-binding-like beta-propeller repeat protein [Pirellulales bacterium]